MKRPSIIQKFRIHGSQETLKGYLHLCDDNGKLHQLDIDIYKEGTIGRNFAHAFCLAVNIGLEHGVPAQVYVDALKGWTFEPKGMVTGSPCVGQCSSMLDLIAQEIACLERGYDAAAKEA